MEKEDEVYLTPGYSTVSRTFILGVVVQPTLQLPLIGHYFLTSSSNDSAIPVYRTTGTRPVITGGYYSSREHSIII